MYGILSRADANGDVEHMYESGGYLASRSLESGGSLTLRSQRRNMTGGVYPSDVYCTIQHIIEEAIILAGLRYRC